MQQPDRIRLQHMLEAARHAQQFVTAKDRTDLENDLLLQFALVRAIEIVGEAASQVSVESREEVSQLPWRALVGMRNRLIHAYFAIDLDILWVTAVRDIPALIAVLERVLDIPDK